MKTPIYNNNNNKNLIQITIQINFNNNISIIENNNYICSMLRCLHNNIYYYTIMRKFLTICFLVNYIL